MGRKEEEGKGASWRGESAKKIVGTWWGRIEGQIKVIQDIKSCEE